MIKELFNKFVADSLCQAVSRSKYGQFPSFMRATQRRKSMSRWFLAVAFLILFSETTLALRCNRHVVVEGYRTSKVFGLCGEPDFTEHKTEYLDTRLGSRNRRFGTSLDIQNLIPIEFEIWTYNFGPRKLLHHLHFKDGRLFKIEIDGYGY